MSKVPQLREQIDAIDHQLVNLFDQRIDIAKSIIKEKEAEGMALLDPAREKQVVDALKSRARHIPEASLKKIFYELFSISRSQSKELTVAFLGPEATFSHMAARERFGSQTRFLPTRTIDEVFHEVEHNRADFGVVPIENSSEGAVLDTLAKFLYTELTIIGEIFIPIKHCLLSMHPIQEVKKLYSHRQPLAQCREWINKNLAHAEILEVSSSAKAAEQASLYHHSAAIGSHLAAKKFGLDIIVEGIEDIKNNTTRFFIIGRNPVPKGSKSKTFVVFSTDHQSGALYRALKPFAENGVNLTMIESKRTREHQWKYVFFADMEGHQEDPHVLKALETLQQQTSLLKIVGSYPLEEGCT